MIAIQAYEDDLGRRPFDRWIMALDANTAARVVTALSRIENGNFSNVKGVGEGVFECVIDFGPGYRVYFGKDGELFVILLVGGSKRTQPKDIVSAKKYWKDYKNRKRLTT